MSVLNFLRKISGNFVSFVYKHKNVNKIKTENLVKNCEMRSKMQNLLQKSTMLCSKSVPKLQDLQIRGLFHRNYLQMDRAEKIYPKLSEKEIISMEEIYKNSSISNLSYTKICGYLITNQNSRLSEEIVNSFLQDKFRRNLHHDYVTRNFVEIACENIDGYSDSLW